MSGYSGKERRVNPVGQAFEGGDRRSHEMCSLVIEHHANLAQMSADISHIKAKIDNGLTEKMEALTKRLDTIDRDSWVTHLMSGGLKKLIGFIIFLVLANALASNAIWALVKSSSQIDVPSQEEVTRRIPHR